MRHIFSKKLIVGLIVFSVFLLGAANQLSAASKQLGGLETTATGIGYTKIADASPSSYVIAQKVGKIINVVLGFLSFIFFALIVGGAFKISGAGGDEAVVTAGKKIIKNGAIGLLILLSAYFITKAFMLFVGNKIFYNPS